MRNRLILEEIAPGVDIEKDILLAKMEFEPKISSKLKEMDKRLFLPEKMVLKEEIKEALG